MIHSILIIGQSNMAGRGSLTSAEPLDNLNGRLKVMRNGRWQNMFRPVNPDRSFSGTCLAESFAAAYANDHPEIDIGIIPCADGGSKLDQWQDGSLLFDNAVNCARLAMRTSHLVGILWHQGEADCGAENYPAYFEKLTAIMSALRRALGMDTIPILVGGLGDFLKDRVEDPKLVNYVHINEALVKFVDTTPYTAFVSAVGLTPKGDNLHFNHKSLQEFGLRYYAAFKTLEDKTRVFDEENKEDDTKRSEMEAL
ncbi:MAG: sialate O-acetylesterase [Clostridia bacterium]|nr:sialate O-acetylesterase [Clostridia bacterium]